MSKVHSFFKKHWKPPYKLLKYTLLLCLISGYINNVNTQTENNDDNDSKDDVVVHTESTPYSVRFYIEDDKFELVNVTCKGLKALEDLEVQELVCLNLNPCTKYFAALQIRNEAGELNTKNMEVETSYAVPTTEMNDPIPAQESMTINWKSTNPTCISKYKLSVYYLLDQSKYYEITNDEQEKIVSELQPCVDHNITLETYDTDNQMVSSRMSTAQTLYAEPDDVTITSIAEVGNSQMKVKWQKPKYTACIQYYYIKWYLKDCGATYQNDTKEEQYNSFEGFLSSENNEGTTLATTTPPAVATTLSPNIDGDDCLKTEKLTDRSATEYTINNLKGCEDYGLEIYINTNEAGNFEPHTFKSPEQVPGLVTVRNADLSPTDVILLWNQPVDNTKCVAYYKISLTGPMQKPPEDRITKEACTTKTDIAFDELFPCGHYDYTIIGVSLNGTDGASMNSNFDTYEAKPTPVRNYRVSEEPRSIEISWDPPDYAELCLNGYRLSGWRDDNIPLPEFDKKTNDTTIQFSNLFACQAYTVQIIPMTKSMNDGELIQIEAETKAIVAKAPSNDIISIYPNSFELSAKTADIDNNCETIFARFICEVTNSKLDVPYKKAERYVERGQVGEISFRALVGPLSPYTEYRCTAALFNVAGWSANGTIIKPTEEYYPDPPESIDVKSISKTAIIFTWKAPKYPNGVIKLYLTYFQRVEAAYFVPHSCSPDANSPDPRETAGFEQNYEKLSPYTTYSIQVAAQNDHGVGEYSVPYIKNTAPSTSEPVVNLKVDPKGPYASVGEYKANVVVSWTLPCKSNGKIEYFLLEFVGEREGYPKQDFNRSVVPLYDEFGHMMHNETNLKAEFNYTVRVAVKTFDVDEISTPINKTFDAPSGIPEPLNETEAAKATVDAYAASNPTKSAKVSFPAEILDSESGKILYIALLLSEKNCNVEPQLRYAAIDAKNEWPDTLTWNQAYKDDSKGCIHQYQSTPTHWYPERPIGSNAVADDDLSEESGVNEVIEYFIGTETCDNADGYCNGPLKPDTEYYLVLRLFTKSGFNDAAILQFKTDSLIELTIILISVVGCLLLAFIVGFIYLWVTKRIVWKRESLHGIEDSFGDTIAKNFAIFYRDVSKPEKINREFKELTVVAMDLSYTASEMGCNKNRYADIFPYDKNRVILDIDTEGSDYINASFIDGYRRKKEYIATQGPKPESTMDFWRMILQHNVRVIVMVTQFREGDVVKCHEYFPFKSKSIEVTVKKKECFEIYDRTEISVSHDQYGLKQKVIHFYFKKWPDHGVPTDPMHLITFVRKVKAEKVPSYSPIVVHCSAGVGRTGTFIGLDVIMQRLRNESKINIYETVKKLRFQRMKMVQTIAQYSFLYACAYELVKHKSTRAALKYQKAHSKKVSFEDDADHNVNSLPTAPPLKFNGRRNLSDLSSVNELDVSDDNNVAVGGSKHIDTSSYGSIPIRFNGFHHNGNANGLVSYDDYDDKDFNSARVRSTESVM